MLHAATGFATLRKVEDCSTFSATCFVIFRYVASCRRGVTRTISSATCFAIALHCILQRKLSRETGPLLLCFIVKNNYCLIVEISLYYSVRPASWTATVLVQTLCLPAVPG